LVSFVSFAHSFVFLRVKRVLLFSVPSVIFVARKVSCGAALAVALDPKIGLRLVAGEAFDRA
jgi:hypothetical protein